jgi:hypothetical protein
LISPAVIYTAINNNNEPAAISPAVIYTAINNNNEPAAIKEVCRYICFFFVVIDFFFLAYCFFLE